GQTSHAKSSQWDLMGDNWHGSKAEAAAMLLNRSRLSMAIPSSRSKASPIRILRLKQVLDLTGLKKTSIYDLQSTGRFPLRVQITAHSVGWIEEEIQSWLAQRVAIRERRSPRGCG